MELKKLKKGNYNFLSALVIVIITTCVSVAAQELDFIPDKAIAENAFNNEDYITALKHYKALSANFSADPLYKYLAGVCMVELKKDPGNAKIILKEAIDGSSALRQVPDKAWYYMGKAYQFSGDFVQAIDAYDIYKESARRKDIKELGIDALIDQCNSGVGAIQDEKPAGQEEIEPEGDIVLQEKEYTEFL
ncbi:MAG TPA: hypothetical protein DEQ09_09100, partial [Bacteroidales bacterium]|nr:hypothetical protein [Bacteroidales bacterium]